jgi:hypothetical protein
MHRDPIPDDVQRFILVSIPSVPYLEALLLLRAEPDATWDAPGLARRLYVGERPAGDLLSALHAAGLLFRAPAETPAYRYHPQSTELAAMIDRLADSYANNLVAVTRLIHSSTSRKAHHFAEAFKWRKDP